MPVHALIGPVAGMNLRDIEGTVTAPSGATERIDVVDLGNSRFTIRFQAKEPGLHTVSLKNKGIHIPGGSRGRCVDEYWVTLHVVACCISCDLKNLDQIGFYFSWLRCLSVARLYYISKVG